MKMKTARTCNIAFIDSVRLISSSPSKLAENIAEELHKDRCKDFKSDIEYMTVNDGSLVLKCKDCKKKR